MWQLGRGTPAPALSSDQLALADKMSELTNAGLQPPSNARLRAHILLCRDYWSKLWGFQSLDPNLKNFGLFSLSCLASLSVQWKDVYYAVRAQNSLPRGRRGSEKNYLCFHGCINTERTTHKTFPDHDKTHLIGLKDAFVLFFYGLVSDKQQQRWC